ncbi:MAG: hypothetical protein JOZ62_14595 [Acidobacteriaceae bacterium]|nr:hypothetical protein [Acidobacteriaceae bacterium]
MLKRRSFVLGSIATPVLARHANKNIEETHPIALETISQLQLHNVRAEPVTYRGRKAVRVTATGPADLSDAARVAVIGGTRFQDGIIEVEIAGDTEPDSPAEFRGFTGIAFRASADGLRYECFYLRPKNGRSEDQLQRNHSAQYISVPEFPWQRLRQKFPCKYESYVDLVPGEWTSVKVVVKGNYARLYVHQAGQPTLIVKGLKHGTAMGAIALWVGPRTIAHFGNLRVTQV